MGQTLMRVLSAIDAVHDDGNLPTIPLIANRYLKTTRGCYHRRGAKALDIELNPHAGGLAFTLLEEIGHFLDHQGLGTDGFGFASEESEVDPALKRWRAAVLGSKPFKQLLKLVKSAKPGFYKRRWVEATSLREVFARSYAQYIAIKSGDTDLLAGLEANRRGGFGEILHWNDEDFRPIMETLDQLFAGRHWT